MNQERRQYFRINGKVAVDYKIITEDEMEHSRIPTQFEVSPFFLLLTQLQNIGSDNDFHLRKIAQKDPSTAAYLESMNEKVEAIAQAVAKSDVEFENLSTQEINLSEGGLSFSSKESIPLNSYLALKVVFEESFSGLLLYGQVLYSGEQGENGEYKIGVEFTDLPESSRMIVARYILSSQARERQQLNEEQY